MIGRPFRMAWHEQDTPEALKEAYQSQKDVYIRTRLHALWLVAAGRSKRRLKLWVFTAGARRDGLGGIEKAVWTRSCPARWEEWVSRGF